MTKHTQSVINGIRVGTAGAWHAAGVPRTELARLVASGELVKVRYGIYAAAGEVSAASADPAMAHALHVAGVIGRVSGGVASHQSAAVLHGLSLLTKPLDGTVSLTVPPGKRAGSYERSGVLRHSAELPAKQVTKIYDLPVTTAGRTVIDIARTSPFMDGVVVADSAIHHLLTNKTELRRVIASSAGWPGVGRARDVVDFANGLAESVLESCARVVFHEHGLPAPELQVPLSGVDGGIIARVDFLWSQYRVAGETDGLLKYKDGNAAIAELRRDRLLRDAGFEVIHFTWQELFEHPDRVIARIRAAFARAERLGAGALPSLSGRSSPILARLCRLSPILARLCRLSAAIVRLSRDTRSAAYRGLARLARTLLPIAAASLAGAALGCRFRRPRR